MKLIFALCAVFAAASPLSSFALAPGQPVMKPGWISPALPSIPDRTFKVTDFGAVADGKTMNTDAFRRATSACGDAGGGRVIVPKGVFLTGPFPLFSHTALVIEKDGVIQAPSKFKDYGLPDPLPATQLGMNALRQLGRPLIHAHHVTDVEISGPGRIDGAGALWWPESAHARRGSTAPFIVRPNLIQIDGCERLHVTGVTLSNSPQFHLVPKSASDVLIENITIETPGDSPNTDGIDPFNCHDVLIRNCTISDGDDDIVIKSPDGAPSTRIEVANCTIKRGHGISIGSDTNSGVSWMLVHDCTFQDTGSALRIKSSRSRGGLVEHIVYQDVAMKNVQTAIDLNFYYDDREGARRPEFKPVGKTTPILRYVSFARIRSEDAERAGMILGLPESQCTNVKLEDVSITSRTGFQIQDAGDLSMHGVSIAASRVLAATRGKKARGKLLRAQEEEAEHETTPPQATPSGSD